MKRRWGSALLMVMVICIGIAAAAADLREAGLRIDLTLQPLYTNTQVHWNFDVGAYALMAFDAGWAVRASAGFDVLSAGPYVGIGLLRAIGSSFALEGDLTMQWTFGNAAPVTTAAAGARFAGASGGLFYELAAFPASWTLASIAGAPATFSFSPSFTVGGGFVLETGLKFGEAITLTFLPIPATAAQPVLPIGAGWMLSTRLTTHLGLDFPATP
jgi:hypothetical protein